MKSLSEIIKESILDEARMKFCVTYFNKVWNKILTNDWKKVVSSEPVSGATYWDVTDMNSYNTSEPDSLIAWHGEGGYWANKYDISKHPEKCGKWDRPFTGKDLEKIEKSKQ